MNIFESSQLIAFARLSIGPPFYLKEANKKFLEIFHVDGMISFDLAHEVSSFPTLEWFLTEALPSSEEILSEVSKEIVFEKIRYELIFWPNGQQEVFVMLKKSAQELPDILSSYSLGLENFIAKETSSTIYRCKYDDHYTMLYLSESIVDITGYQSKELERNFLKSFGQLIVEEDRAYVHKKIKEAVERKDAWDIRYRIIHKSDEIKWISERGKAVYDEFGHVWYLDGYLLDITDFKNIERSLSEENAYYQDLVNAQPQGIYRIVFKQAGRFHEGEFLLKDQPLELEVLNEVMENLTGLPVKSKYNSLSPITNLLHPDDRKGFFKEMAEVLQKDSSFLWEGRMRKDPSDEYYWVQFNSTSRICPNGDSIVTGILIYINDEKLSKFREEHFKNLLKYIIENMDSTVAMLDKEHRFMYTSQKYKTDFGIQDQEILGVNAYEVFPNLPDRIKVAHQLALEGISSSSEKDEIILPDKVLYNKWSCIPWFEDHEKVGGYIVYIEDITDRVILENTLKEEQNKLKEAQRIAKIGNWEFDLQTQELFWSDEAYAILGIERGVKSLVYADFLEFLHPDDKDKVQQAFLSAIKDHKPYEVRHRVLLKNGEVKVVQEKSEIYYDEQGQALRAVGTVQDITKAMEQEEALKKSNQYLNNLFTYANAPIIVWDSEFKITKFNKAFEQYTGRKEEDVLGEYLEILFPPEFVESNMKLIQQTSTGERWETVEIPIQHLSGDVFTFIWNSAPIVDFDENRTIATIAQGQDITERKRATEEIKALNQNLEQLVEERTLRLNKSLEILNNTSSRVPGMIFQLTQSKEGKLRFQFVSPGIKELWGISPEEVAEDATIILEKIHPDDIGLVKNAMYASLTDPKPLSHEYRIIDDLGTVKWILTNSLTYVDEDSNIHWYGHSYDITSRKQVESEIIKAKEEAEVANQAKSKFLSRMSHELRTPLNSILGFAQLLELNNLPETQKKSLDFIISSGKHLLNLINEVLDISAIESGNYRLNIEPVEIVAAIEEVLGLVKPAAEKKEILLKLSPQCESDIFASVDRLRLKQILMNLLDNAIKYNVHKGRVTIFCGIDMADPKQIFITIQDTGRGIAKEDIDALYDPFQRLGAENSSIEGSGLGLTIVKHLVEAMGGSIHVISELGIGTGFTVFFPLSDKVTDTSDAENNYDEEPLSVKDKQLTTKILYIEDNNSNVELVKDILEHVLPNVQLSVSKLGIPGVRLALNIKPQLILLDLDLPDVYGAEVLSKLKLNPMTKEIPVLIVSADTIPEKIDQLLKSGASDYLVKPLDIKLFVRTIERFLMKKPTA